MITLDEDQMKAAMARTPEAVWIAGPGSGKTRTLVETIAMRIAGGLVEPRKIIAITFTNVGALELRERLKALGFEIGYVGTLHAFALRMLRDHGGSIGYSSLSLVNEDDAAEVLNRVAARLRWKGTEKALLDAKRRGKPTTYSSLLDTVIGEFYDELRQNNMVDFDLILSEFLRLVRAGGFPRDKFDELYVDEAQDSAAIDWAIYNEIQIERKRFVGDPDQSIFSFRGGRLEKFLVKTATAPTFVLEKNYRSDQAITRAAQTLIEFSTQRFKKRTISVSREHGTIKLHDCRDAGAEIERVIEAIFASPYSLAESAILARTNAIANDFKRALLAADLQVRQKNRVRLPHDWRQARLLAQICSDPYNDVAALQFARLRGKDADALSAAARKTGVPVSSVFNIPRGGNAYEMREFGLILSDRDFTAETKVLIDDIMRKLPREADWLDLSEAINSYESEEVYGEQPKNAIEVSTIHGAKGREWPVVYLVGMEQEVFPGRMLNQLEEERRLCYVGVTRAKNVLHVSWSRQRMTEWQGLQKRTPSQFVGEMGFSLSSG